MNDNASRLLNGTPELPPMSVALTYDDGPGPRSAELARVLGDEGVPATFFVLGESLGRFGEVVATYQKFGHTIGLHADIHRPFQSVEHARTELRRCADRITAHLDEAVWFRPPYGVGAWPVPGFAGPVGWHTHGRDWEITYRRGQTVEACVDAIASDITERGGGIVLLHDYAAATEFKPAGLTEADLDLQVVEITSALVRRLRGAGFTFVGLPAAASARTPERSDPPALTKAESASSVPGVSMGSVTTGGGPLGAREDLQTLRLFRATAKHAGGTLDLVMPMRVDGDGPRLFCAPPLVGLSWCYLALLPHVDPTIRLYGLQARGLRRPEPLPTGMREMARDYANQLRMIQPTGPYHLLGWSLGGNIAFAIAEELESRGEQIGLLVILDSALLNLDEIESNETWQILNLVLTQFGYVPALTPADPHPEARMLELVRRRPGLGLDEWPDQRVRALQRVIRNNVTMARTHQPGVVHCPLLFFSAAHNEPTLAEKLNGWRPFVDGPFEAVELDCHHRYMLLPEPVARLGPALSERLARTATAVPPPIVQPARSD